MQATNNRQVTAKHFPVSEEDSFVQYSVQMSEQEYNNLILGDGEAIKLQPGKNKMLL